MTCDVGIAERSERLVAGWCRPVWRSLRAVDPGRGRSGCWPRPALVTVVQRLVHVRTVRPTPPPARPRGRDIDDGQPSPKDRRDGAVRRRWDGRTPHARAARRRAFGLVADGVEAARQVGVRLEANLAGSGSRRRRPAGCASSAARCGPTSATGTRRSGCRRCPPPSSSPACSGRVGARLRRTGRGPRRDRRPAAHGQLGPRRRLGHRPTTPLTTVAERLKPEALYDRFVAYREARHGGAAADRRRARSGTLVERLRAGPAGLPAGRPRPDRDGVAVDFFGEPTRMPRRPGAARVPPGPPDPGDPVVRGPAPTAAARIHEQVAVPDDGHDDARRWPSITQALADAFAAGHRRAPGGLAHAAAPLAADLRTCDAGWTPPSRRRRGDEDRPRLPLLLRRARRRAVPRPRPGRGALRLGPRGLGAGAGRRRRPAARRTSSRPGRAVPVPYNGSVARLSFGSCRRPGCAGGSARATSTCCTSTSRRRRASACSPAGRRTGRSSRRSTRRTSGRGR